MSKPSPHKANCPPTVPRSGGDSKSLFEQLKTQKKEGVPPCPPFLLKRTYSKSVVRDKGGHVIESNIYNNNREKRGDRGTKESEHKSNLPETKDLEACPGEKQRGDSGGTAKKALKDLDRRFRSPSFHRNVKTVLNHLDLPTTYKVFKKYDKLFNWEKYAYDIRHPVFGKAKCFILDFQGSRVRSQQENKYLILEIRAKDKAEAERIIEAQKCFEIDKFPLSDEDWQKEVQKSNGCVLVKSLPEQKVNYYTF